MVFERAQEEWIGYNKTTIYLNETKIPCTLVKMKGFDFLWLQKGLQPISSVTSR